MDIKLVGKRFLDFIVMAILTFVIGSIPVAFGVKGSIPFGLAFNGTISREDIDIPEPIALLLFILGLLIWLSGTISTIGVVFRSKNLSQRDGFIEAWRFLPRYLSGYLKSNRNAPQKQEGIEPSPRKKLKVKRFIIAGGALLLLIIGVILIIQYHSERTPGEESGSYPGWKALSYYRSGDAYYDQGLYAQAATEFEKAVACDGNRARYHLALGNAYYKLGRYDKAIVVYKSAIALKPYEGLIRENLADAYFAQGLHDKAIIEYTIAIRLVPYDETIPIHGKGAYKKKLLEKFEAAGGKPPVLLPKRGVTQENLNELYKRGYTPYQIIERLRRDKPGVEEKYRGWLMMGMDAEMMLEEIIRMDREAYLKNCLEVSIPTEKKGGQKRD